MIYNCVYNNFFELNPHYLRFFPSYLVSFSSPVRSAPRRPNMAFYSPPDAITSAPAGMGASSGLFQYHPRTLFALDTVTDASSLYPGDYPDTFEAFSLAFSPDSRYLAAGGANGVVRVFTPAGAHVRNLVSDGQSLPCTRVVFRPASFVSNAGHVMLAVCADGSVTHWHVPTQTCLFHHTEPENQIFAADFAPDGDRFATAGRDTRVRIYDEGTKLLTHTLQSAAGRSDSVQGHTNRVFAVKFAPLCPDTVYSAGWDNTVQLWDLRTGRSERDFFGPHVCGDALDVSPDGRRLLTGSCRPDHAIQVWDLASGRVELELEANNSAVVPPSSSATGHGHGHGNSLNASFTTSTASLTTESAAAAPVLRPLMPYACAFSPDGRWVAAGGSGDGHVRVYDVRAGQTHAQNSVKSLSNTAKAPAASRNAWSAAGDADATAANAAAGAAGGSEGECVDQVFIEDKGVYAVKWSADGRYLAATGKGPHAMVLNEVYYTLGE